MSEVLQSNEESCVSESCSNEANKRLVEFIHDLKEAIETGQFHQTSQVVNEEKEGMKQTSFVAKEEAAILDTADTSNHTDQLPVSTTPTPTTVLTNLINVDNLSNQTFTYIINWLKQQQQKKQHHEPSELNGNSLIMKDEVICSEMTSSEAGDIQFDATLTSSKEDLLYSQELVTPTLELNSGSQSCSSRVAMDYSSEIKYLRNKLKANETEKEKFIAKLAELQKENLDLKTKLLLRPGHNHQPYNITADDGAQSEIANLKSLVQELVKANEEKDKKLDELTKQVIRFKRIQDIVLSAQTNSSNSIKNKNYDDFTFELNNTENHTNPSPYNHEELSSKLQINHNHHQPQLYDTTNLQHPTQTTQSEATSVSNGCSNPKQSTVVEQTQIVSSCSLTSSISSSSSASSTTSSSSSTSSSASSNSSLNNQNHQQTSAALTAPLATITEFINYSSSTLATPNPSISSSQQNRQHNLSSDTLTNVDAISNPVSHNTNSITNNTTTTTNKTNTAPAMTASSTTLKDQLLFDSAFGKPNKSSKANKTTKYSSAMSLSTQNESIKKSPLNNFKLTLSPTKSNSTVTAPTNSTNRSLRNFFGKLIRTSLVNINESSFTSSSKHDLTNGRHKPVLQVPATSVQAPGSPVVSSTTNSPMSNPFKRGGFRSTANARLQNNYTTCAIRQNDHIGGSVCNVDTLTFSKWTSAQVCEWLARNGFESYFPLNSEGIRAHKWIKNGLHLLQATQYDYERELGIKNSLHRKKLSLLLQGLYTNLSSDSTTNCQTIEQTNLAQLDQHWVTKWLDDIGLPQYKDTFSDHMIDGRMLHHLSQEDFSTLSINSELHYLSIKRAIHVLRLNSFDPHCLRRRPSGDDAQDRAECSLWTNHRCMEWLRSIDLSEYAPNLRGSGVHGGLMVYEARFNPQCLADILSIPASKTLLRRHLSTLFTDLIGPDMSKLKREAQMQTGYVQLTAQSKVKHVKKSSASGGSGLLFTNAVAHKRTKSQDSKEFLGLPMMIVDKMSQQQLQQIQLQQQQVTRTSNKNLNNMGQSATLPVNSSSLYSDNVR